jgi:hypothetical protein
MTIVACLFGTPPVRDPGDAGGSASTCATGSRVRRSALPTPPGRSQQSSSSHRSRPRFASSRPSTGSQPPGSCQRGCARSTGWSPAHAVALALAARSLRLTQLCRSSSQQSAWRRLRAHTQTDVRPSLCDPSIRRHGGISTESRAPARSQETTPAGIEPAPASDRAPRSPSSAGAAGAAARPRPTSPPARRRSPRRSRPPPRVRRSRGAPCRGSGTHRRSRR